MTDSPRMTDSPKPTRPRLRRSDTFRRTMSVVVPASSDVRARASSATQTLWRNASKRVSRTKEILRQSIGKADKTDDGTFEDYVDNFNRGSQKVTKLHKHLENYVQSLRAMNNASTALFDVFKECYEDEFSGRSEALESVDAIMASMKELVREVDKSINHVVAFKSQFPTVKTKIDKRNKKLLDFDGWRHEMVELQNAKKKIDLEKIAKAEDRASESKRLYETLNYELYDSLPEIHDQRISVFAKTFNCVFKGESNFHEKNTKLRQTLIETISKLESEAASGTYATPRLTAPELTLPERLEPPPRKAKTPADAANEASANVDAVMRLIFAALCHIYSETVERFSASLLPQERDGAGDQSNTLIGEQDKNNNTVGGEEKATPDDEVFEAAAAAATSTAPAAVPAAAATEAAAAEAVAAPVAETLPNGVVETRVVTHPYEGKEDDELTLTVGQVVNVTTMETDEELDDGWSFGFISEKPEKKGLFPLNFTEPT